MGISRKEVEHIALLSRLRLSPEELGRFTRELDSILAHAQKIGEIDTSGIPPTTHVLPIANVMRKDDTPCPSLPVAEAMANAPDASGHFFRVPKVTE